MKEKIASIMRKALKEIDAEIKSSCKCVTEVTRIAYSQKRPKEYFEVGYLPENCASPIHWSFKEEYIRKKEKDYEQEVNVFTELQEMYEKEALTKQN